MEVYRGDIFYVENSYGTEGSEQRPGRPALIVSNDTGNKFAPIVSVVWLTTAEKKPLPTHCEICAEVPSTAICEQIVTVSKTRLGMYIRTATEEEMQKVDKCLMIALGLDLPLVTDVTAVERVNQQEIDDMKMKLEGAERELDEVRDHNKYLSEELERTKLSYNRMIVDNKNCTVSTDRHLERENKRLRIMNELLEEQNEKLLDKLIG